MADKKRIKISDDFFSAPETAEGKSSRRTTTEAQAMNIILGVSRPEGETASSRPQGRARNVPPAKSHTVGERATVQIDRGSAPKAERTASSIHQPVRSQAGPSSSSVVGTAFAFAFNMTTLFVQNITLPWRLMFRGATAVARTATSIGRD